MYLLDTNVISELRRVKPHGAVSAWFQTIRKSDVRIPAAVIGEIQSGIEVTRSQNAPRAQELEAWLERVLAYYEIIPMDATIFREWSKLMANSSPHLVTDAMIAATARIHKLTVVTRNTKDFQGFGVLTFNPFTYKSGQ